MKLTLTGNHFAFGDHENIQRRYRLRKRELMEWWNRKLLTIVDGPADSVVAQMLNVGRQYPYKC